MTFRGGQVGRPVTLWLRDDQVVECNLYSGIVEGLNNAAKWPRIERPFSYKPHEHIIDIQLELFTDGDHRQVIRLFALVDFAN